MAKHDEDRGSGNYPVGYGKPPLHSRFKKGQSGNPAGRRKGSLNFSSVLLATLNEKVVVNESPGHGYMEIEGMTHGFTVNGKFYDGLVPVILKWMEEQLAGK
jgi:hypothetical protein